jgi:hypothetical protein
MNNIFRYAIFAGVFYFGINWLADNPKRVNNIRNQVNSLVQTFL